MPQGSAGTSVPGLTLRTTTDTVAELRARLERAEREAAAHQRQLERYAANLRESYRRERARAQQLRRSYKATVRALSNAVEARDAYTGKHAERVAAYGLLLTRRIDSALADDPQTEFGFLLHDVGKVAVPDQVLHKPDDLRDDESEVMRSHVVTGWEIVKGVPFLERGKRDVAPMFKQKGAPVTTPTAAAVSR